MSNEAPLSLDEALAYADSQIAYYVNHLADDLPPEQIDEIAQDCRLRICRIAQRTRVNLPWRAFIQKHVKCTFLDYQRRYHGFRKPITKEMALAICEQYENRSESESLEINWPLLARLCSRDKNLYVFVRHKILGQTLAELANEFGVSRERVGQRVRRFIERIKRAHSNSDIWMLQTIYALGISELMGLPDCDHNVGWDLEPVSMVYNQVLEVRFDNRKVQGF